ncbi:MAG: hypothetical protein KF726_26375, partial [Anaerolineae bacterium]|nr:hypothetical protein [Anaerolineae bacterium]
MRDRDLLYTSKTVQVSFALEPIYNVITILEDLALCNSCQGMGEWHYQTADALPTEFMQRHRLIFGVLDFMFHEIVPTENCTGFSAYIEAFAAFDPFVLRDAVLERVIEVAEQWADA